MFAWQSSSWPELPIRETLRSPSQQFHKSNDVCTLIHPDLSKYSTIFLKLSNGPRFQQLRAEISNAWKQTEP